MLLHGLVLSMVRYTPPFAGDAPAVPESWLRFVAEGAQFPWLTVVHRTPSIDVPLLQWAGLPYALLALLGVLLVAVWWGPLRRGLSADA